MSQERSVEGLCTRGRARSLETRGALLAYGSIRLYKSAVFLCLKAGFGVFEGRESLFLSGPLDNADEDETVRRQTDYLCTKKVLLEGFTRSDFLLELAYSKEPPLPSKATR